MVNHAAVRTRTARTPCGSGQQGMECAKRLPGGQLSRATNLSTSQTTTRMRPPAGCRRAPAARTAAGTHADTQAWCVLLVEDTRIGRAAERRVRRAGRVSHERCDHQQAAAQHDRDRQLCKNWRHRRREQTAHVEGDEARGAPDDQHADEHVQSHGNRRDRCRRRSRARIHDCLPALPDRRLVLPAGGATKLSRARVRN
eukprot:3079490-Prymnesium_polylepis.2